MNYTDEELQVFRMCIKLKNEGCKTSGEAELAIYKLIWNLSRSEIHRLVKHWFYNREKIDVLLTKVLVPTQIE